MLLGQYFSTFIGEQKLNMLKKFSEPQLILGKLTNNT
jgi:hypothetical protein